MIKEYTASIAAMIFLLSIPLAWLTHVVTCIQAEKWLFLLAGAIIFPIGILHGFGLWVGVF